MQLTVENKFNECSEFLETSILYPSATSVALVLAQDKVTRFICAFGGIRLGG